LEGAVILDTLGGIADSTVVRVLSDGALLINNGAIAFSACPGETAWACARCGTGSSAAMQWTGNRRLLPAAA
jgi:hypothetical protein